MKLVPFHGRSRRATRQIGLTALCAALASAVLLWGCTDAPKKVVPRYTTLPKKIVPSYLADTILQYTDLNGTDPYPVSGYGLVANLNGTGGSKAPTAVRAYIVKEINRHNVGNHGLGDKDPEELLGNKSFAIVRVDGNVPPGARVGANWSTWFDVRVSALPESDTTSLSHGDLYRTDLKVDGTNPMDPGGETIAVVAQAQGPIFINPSYVFDTSDSPTVRNGRRNGVILGGARPMNDRPLILRLRSPERRMARAIEHRINEQFQEVVDDDLRIKHIAAAQDEGIIYVYVPKVYSNDWNHFAGVLKHLYLRGGSPDYAALKAQELADIAVKPDAPLADITYAWEGLGKPALHAIMPLMSSPKPDVQYAAARAAAFIGDPAAVPTLLDIARTHGNSFRVNAVETLGQLAQTPMVDSLLRQLLDSDQATVRIEAYKVLARHEDLEHPSGGPLYTRVIRYGNNEKFIIDVVRCGGTPLVYASRQGIPRLAIFGAETALNLPALFVTMSDRFSISSGDDGSLTLFYRGAELQKPLKIKSSPQLAEVAARLGGEGSPGEKHLDFSYADVVAMLQAMIREQKVSGWDGHERQPASFVLQDVSPAEQAIDTTPLLRDNGSRPQADHAQSARPKDEMPLLAPGPNVVGMSGSEIK